MSRGNDTYASRARPELMPEAEWLRQRYAGEGWQVTRIAAEAGCDRSVIYAALHHHGIPLRGRTDVPSWQSEWDDVLVEELGRGTSIAALTEQLGVSHSTIREHAGRLGLREEPEGADQLRRMHEAGLTRSEMAAALGVHRTTVRRRLADLQLPARPRGRRPGNATEPPAEKRGGS